MDQLFSNFIGYTEGMSSSRQGLVELTDVICRLGLNSSVFETIELD